MFRPLLRALPVTLALAAPASALDLEAMSDAEREAFRAEVRAYLLDNPEVLMESIAVLDAREKSAAATADADLAKANAAALFESEHDWVGGNPEGDITIVEFMDYRCGYCRRAFPEVEELVGTDGNIRFVVKEFPILGEQSLLASQFAIAVRQTEGDDAYKDVHDALMSMRSDVTEDALEGLAETLGLDYAALSERMHSPEVAEVIAANHQLGQKMQISGTPSFVFEDQMVRGYVPLDQMRDLVESLRKG